jgi:hypothetical protein
MGVIVVLALVAGLAARNLIAGEMRGVPTLLLIRTVRANRAGARHDARGRGS